MPASSFTFFVIDSVPKKNMIKTYKPLIIFLILVPYNSVYSAFCRHMVSFPGQRTKSVGEGTVDINLMQFRLKKSTFNL